MTKNELNKIKYLLFFSGALLGGAGGVFFTKNYYQKKYEEMAEAEINSVKETFRKRDKQPTVINETHIHHVSLDQEPNVFGESITWLPLSPEEQEEERKQYEMTLDEFPYSQVVNLYEKPSLEEIVAVRASLATVEEKETADDIRQQVVDGKLSMTEAREKMRFVPLNPGDPEDPGARLLMNVFKDRVEIPDEEIDEDEDDEDDEDDEEEVEEDPTDYSEEEHDGPYVIDYDTFANTNTHYSKLSLTYYDVDNTLTDDGETVVADIEGCLGNDALDNFGTGSMDKNVVYIRNDSIDCDYEVTRLERSYVADILGYETTPIRTRMRDSDD